MKEHLESIGALFLLGFYALFQSLGGSLSFDELIQYDTIFDQPLSSMLYHIFTQDHQLPLQYLILHPIINTHHGVSSFLLRLPSLIFSIGSLLFFYKITEFFIKKRAFRLLSVGLFFSSSLFMTYAVSSRPYSAMLFFSCALITCLLNFKKHPAQLIWPSLATLSFTLLGLTHFFGALYALVILVSFLWWNKGLGRWIGIGLSLILVGLSVYWISNQEVHFLPQRSFPSLNKTLGGLNLFFLGPVSFILISILTVRYKFYKQIEFLKGSLGFFLPLIISFIFSWSIRPLFEYRFFIPSIIFSSLYLGLLLEKFSLEKRVSKYIEKGILIILILQCLPQTIFLKKAEAIPNSLEASRYIEKRFNADQMVLACGNCPRFYLGTNRLSCMKGWNFKKKSSNHPEVVKILMIYKINQKFCQDLISRDYELLKSFEGIELYQRSSVSR